MSRLFDAAQIAGLPRLRHEKLTGLIAPTLGAALAHPTPDAFRMDSNTVITNLEGKINIVLQEMTEDAYPELFTQDPAFPISYEGGSGAEAVVWRELHGAGEMKPLASAGKNLPMVSASAEPQAAYVAPHAIGFGWSYAEMLRAAREGMSLDSIKAKVARQAYAERVETLAIIGDPDLKIGGLLRSKIPSQRLPTSATDPAPIIPDSSSVTADQLLTALNAFIGGLAVSSNEAFQPQGKTLVVTPRLFRVINTTRLSSTNPTVSIRERLERDWGIAIKQSLKLYNIAAATVGLDANIAANFSFMMLLDLRPISLQLHIPHKFEAFPVQQLGFDYVVPCYAEIGDVAVRQPKANRIGWYVHS